MSDPLTPQLPPDNDPSVKKLTDITEQTVGAGEEIEPPSTVELRKKVAQYLLVLFIATNLAVLVAIGGLALVDYGITSQLVNHATTQPAAFEKLLGSPETIDKARSVSSGVLMALIGATTVQVGAGVLTITQYLFPKK